MVEIDPEGFRRLPKKDPEFTELRKRREFDEEVLRRKAIEAGYSQEEADAHAREHYKGQGADHTAEEETALLRDLGVHGEGGAAARESGESRERKVPTPTKEGDSIAFQRELKRQRAREAGLTREAAADRADRQAWDPADGPTEEEARRFLRRKRHRGPGRAGENE